MFSLRKSFWKINKSNWKSSRKANKSNQDQGQVKTINKYNYDNEDSPLISKQKEIFNELADEKLKEITELHEKFNCDDLLYRYKGFLINMIML